MALLKKATLLGAVTLLAVLMWAGPASAVENGLIYHSDWGGVYSVDPTSSTSQPNKVAYKGYNIDISRDILVYDSCGWFGCDKALYLFPLFSNDSLYGETPVEITNLSSSAKELKNPKFSPDRKTIYFAGQHVLESDNDTFGIYSVPTYGGEAKKIPIDTDDTAYLSSFNVSHDGSKLVLGGKGGIVTVPVTGGVPTKITNDSCQGATSPNGTSYYRKGASSPDFSPDDKTIIYTSPIYKNDTCGGDGSKSVANTLFTTPVNNDGTQPETALFPKDLDAPYPPYSADRSKWHGTYSPDGKYITFENWTETETNIVTAPATGGSFSSTHECNSCDNPLWAEKGPDTTLTSQPPSFTQDTTASFEFSSNDPAATFECRLDYYYGKEVGDGFESCTSPKVYPDVTFRYPDAPELDTAEGWHTFEVRAVSSGGASDPTPTGYGWEVDTTAPTVGSVSPASSASNVALTANAEASFSEAIDQSTLTSGTFTLTRKGSTSSPPPVSAKVSYDPASSKATLDPASDLEANTTYTATIKGGSDGAKDRAGNALVNDYSWTFTTTAPPPDTTKPTVQSLVATDLSGNVPLRKTSFKATFSEKMKTSTLSTTTFKLYKCSSTTSTTCTTQIAATDAPVTPSTDGLSATLNPYGTTSTLLAKNTRYKVVVTTGAQDLAGNALAQEKSSYFNTGRS